METIVVMLGCVTFLWAGFKMTGWLEDRIEANPGAKWVNFARKVHRVLITVLVLLTIAFLIIFSGDGSVIRP